MKKINVKKILGFLALGGLLAVAAPAERAQALSPASPGIAAAVQDASKLTTEVRWHHHHRWHRHHGWRHRHWGWRHHWRHRHGGWRRHHWHHRHWRW